MESSRNKQSTTSKLHVALNSVMMSWESSPVQCGCDRPLVAPGPLVTELPSVLSDRLSQHHIACVQVILVFLNNGPRSSGRVMLAIWVRQREARKCPASGRWVQCIQILEKEARPHSHSFYYSTLYFYFITVVVNLLPYLICRWNFTVGVYVWGKT